MRIFLFLSIIFVIFGAKGTVMNYDVVRGIVYKPHKKENLDIYGNVINLEDLRSYRHEPIRVQSEEPIKTYQTGQYRFGQQTENSTEEQSEQIPAASVIIPTSGGSHFIESGVQVGNMQGLLDEASKHGIYFRVTSGHRPGATTSSGKQSFHATGDAIDITPLEGTSGDDFRNTLRSNTQFLTGMRDNGYGIIDETTEEMLARTGGSGAHFHIGKDNLALEGLKQFIV